jgi:phosphoribosylamine--glycine ligase
MTKIFIIGKSGRLDCIADALAKSTQPKEIYTFSEINNPGLIKKSKEAIEIGKTEDIAHIETYASKIKPDFAIIGPEEPLAVGVVDMLTKKLNIPCIGPTKSLARLESSKSFTRKLISKYSIPGNLEYKIFLNSNGLESYLRKIGEFVVKPDGLTGGKGVKIYKEHLNSIEEALQYCKLLFEKYQRPVVIEEKLEGEEFSLQSLCDGQHVVDMIVAQDHKRAFEGDTGPNTGGMGSYSCENHCLPFLSKKNIQEASQITSAVAKALLNELNEEYKGILYGGFIITKNGLRLLEFNARFGDPEVMNVLPILKTDFIDICESIINGTLNKIPLVFENKATVCKYVVPKGYPISHEKVFSININDDMLKTDNKLRIYYGAVNKKQNKFYLTGSRAVAFVGIGDNLKEAEHLAEDATSMIKGPVRHRKDIGTYTLIQKRINHMKKIEKEGFYVQSTSQIKKKEKLLKRSTTIHIIK